MGDHAMMLYLEQFGPKEDEARALGPDDFDRWCADPRPLTFEEWIECQSATWST